MATSQVQTVSTGADKAKLAAASALVVLSLAGYYLLSAQGQWVQWLALVMGLAAAAGAFFASEPGRQLIAFGRDAWREVRKVVWPAPLGLSRRQRQSRRQRDTTRQPCRHAQIASHVELILRILHRSTRAQRRA